MMSEKDADSWWSLFCFQTLRKIEMHSTFLINKTRNPAMEEFQKFENFLHLWKVSDSAEPQEVYSRRKVIIWKVNFNDGRVVTMLQRYLFKKIQWSSFGRISDMCISEGLNFPLPRKYSHFIDSILGHHVRIFGWYMDSSKNQW